ncbi:YicC/YloC family endoribonuclease [Aliikangiella coralliicola]|uniref:YicC family protein n=1 Tax=Aliikangiella coralliicola TaxID=2592383 RepID=A0A545UH42_9GAMM|nr:YicC/YloC family endoribonuclease [Aliikangiella coralliicola]TQV88786.1 YicC family protein [Aliikangiella coralliicola]
MILSMTAFARQSVEKSWGNGTWELRSVNSRFLETNFRLPESFRYLEGQLREKLRKKLKRGKVDCNLRIDTSCAAEGEFSINRQLASGLLKSHEELQNFAGIQQQPDLSRLMFWPGINKSAEVDSDKMEAELLEGLDQAIDQLINMRRREGESLTEIIQQRLSGMEEQVVIVRQEMPALLQAQRDKILARFEEVQLEFDEQRLEQELVLMAQKADVDEELDRLDTHVKEVARLLNKGGTVGRRLDFLMQELNREANTLGSKSISVKTTNASVELKVLIEQMREQIQNIE